MKSILITVNRRLSIKYIILNTIFLLSCVSNTVFASHTMFHFDGEYEEFNCSVKYSDTSSLSFVFSNIDEFKQEKLSWNRYGEGFSGFSEYAHMVYLESEEQNLFVGFRYPYNQDLGIISGSINKLLQSSSKEMFTIEGPYLVAINNAKDMDITYVFQNNQLELKITGRLLNKLRKNLKFINFWAFRYNKLPLKCSPLIKGYYILPGLDKRARPLLR